MFFDLIGMSGVILIVTLYALAQWERIDTKGLWFSLLNAIGAAMVLVSLSVDFNLSAFVIEAFWLLISLSGCYRVLKKRAATKL